MRRRWLGFNSGVVLVLGLLLAGIALQVGVREETGPHADVPGEPATVLRVVDGDTIIVRVDGEQHRVRYIGIDAPEIANGDSPAKPFGLKATAFNQELVDGKTVWLEKDVSDVDRFGRLLRYVWLDDGRMANAALVEQGFASAVTFPPDVAYAAEFARLEQEARANQLGLWVGR